MGRKKRDTERKKIRKTLALKGRKWSTGFRLKGRTMEKKNGLLFGSGSVKKIGTNKGEATLLSVDFYPFTSTIITALDNSSRD